MSVLLGLKDESIIDSSGTGWETNKIGGARTPYEDVHQLAIKQYNSIPILSRADNGTLKDWITKSCGIPSCSHCGRPMYLVLQIYCPLEKSVYHRTIYVFVCIIKQCWSKQQGWRVFRSQLQDLKKAPESTTCDWSPETKNDIDLAGKAQNSQDWCDEADDWGLEDEEDSTVIKKVTRDAEMDNDRCGVSVEEFQELNIDDSSDSDCSGILCSDIVATDDMVITDSSIDTMRRVLAPNPSSDNKSIDKQTDTTVVDSSPIYDKPPDAFNSYYISVVDESFYVAGDDETHIQSLIKDYEQQYGSEWNEGMNTRSSGKSGAEHYEKDQLRHGDRMFHKFMKRISSCSNQLVRYNWNGCPLLMAPLKKLEANQPLSNCPYCKGEQVFELQLMPALVSALKFSDLADPVVEFGTVIIFTCKNSCWQNGDPFREEAVYIQEDPDQHLFK